MPTSYSADAGATCTTSAPPEQLANVASDTPFDRRSGSARDHVIDGLRAVAVLCVIVGHFILFRLASIVPSVPPFANRIAGSLAVTGVEIFFLISGYVITRLLLRERRRYGRTVFPGILCPQILRIMPAFYVYLVVISVFMMGVSQNAAHGDYFCGCISLQHRVILLLVCRPHLEPRGRRAVLSVLADRLYVDLRAATAAFYCARCNWPAWVLPRPRVCPVR